MEMNFPTSTNDNFRLCTPIQVFHPVVHEPLDLHYDSNPLPSGYCIFHTEVSFLEHFVSFSWYLVVNVLSLFNEIKQNEPLQELVFDIVLVVWKANNSKDQLLSLELYDGYRLQLRKAFSFV